METHKTSKKSVESKSIDADLVQQSDIETNEDGESEEKVAAALEQVSLAEEQALTSLDEQVSQAPALLGVDPAQAEAIFKEKGFDEQIKQVKQKIRELASQTQEKLLALLGIRAIRTENIDLSSPRAQVTTERIAKSMEHLRSAERAENFELLPKTSLLADADHIENQQIDIVQSINGDLRIIFKLAEKKFEALKKRLPHSNNSTEENQNYFQKKFDAVRKAMVRMKVMTFRRGKIEYSGQTKHAGSGTFEFECYEKEIEGGFLRVADSSYRSTDGLVEITIPKGRAIGQTPENLQKEIERVLESEFGIKNGTYEPTAEDINAYKIARYKWFHKTEEVPEGIEDRLVRKEVAPGYHTFVEEGWHKEHMKKGGVALYHKIHSNLTLSKIIRAGALLSTHERYRRGLIIHGMSSTEDMQTGGADSVFTRLVTAEGLKSSGTETESISSGSPYFIFEPRILDRTDWYAYTSDAYGSTRPETFNSRVVPEKLIERSRKTHFGSNEQMFRTGISLEDVKAIGIQSEYDAVSLYERLLLDGITEIAGRPLEDMIVVARSYEDAVTVSSGKAPKNAELRKRFKEKKKQIMQSAAKEKGAMAA